MCAGVSEKNGLNPESSWSTYIENEAKVLQFMKSCRPSKSCMTVQTTVGNNKQDGEQDEKRGMESLWQNKGSH